jgi:hypothetical protein
MSKKLNISVLVAARDEYIEQLKCILIPMYIQGFNSIYQDAKKLTEERKEHGYIYNFQYLLKQIIRWNQSILQEEAKRIKRKCPYIMDIVTAIFVSSVKILASIRLKGNNDNVRIKIPSSDIFLHSIYMEAGSQIYLEPKLFYHRPTNEFVSEQQKREEIKNIIRNAVDETIRNLLPFNEILTEFLADSLNDNADVPSDSDSEESDISDPDEESINGKDLGDVGDGIGSDSEFDSEEEIDEEPRKFNINDSFGNRSSEPVPEPILEPPTFPTFQQPQSQPFQAKTFDDLNNGINEVQQSGYQSDSSSGSSSSSSSSSSSGSRHHRHHQQPQQQPQQPQQQPQQQFQQQPQQQKQNYSFF